MISYALSMIPPWREALGQALDVVAPGGSLHCVDFGDCSGLPGPFKTALRRWLAAFDVSPRDDLGETLAALAASRGLTSATEAWRRGYATLAVASRSPDEPARLRAEGGDDSDKPTISRQLRARAMHSDGIFARMRQAPHASLRSDPELHQPVGDRVDQRLERGVDDVARDADRRPVSPV